VVVAGQWLDGVHEVLFVVVAGQWLDSVYEVSTWLLQDNG